MHLAHFFLPQESNNYRARILHHSFLTLLGGFFLLFQLFLSSAVIIRPQVLGYAAQISPEKVVELVNQERMKAGISPLKLNSLLSEAALRKAGDMFAFNYWAHNSPSGRSPWDFFKEVGYNFSFAGENLARDFPSPEAAVAAWMASLTHKENILNPKYKEMGLAVIEGTLGGAETTLVVQFFGTPLVSAGEVLPETIPTQISTQSLIAASTQKAKPFINPFSLTRDLGILLFVFLGGILLVDGLVAHRQKTFRLTGRTLAHTLFLFGAILILLILPQGAIL